MKLENIKAALQARVTSLNINPQAVAPVVTDENIGSQPDKSDTPVATSKPATTKVDKKVDTPQASSRKPVQVQPAVKSETAKSPDKATPPAQADKPVDKVSTTKGDKTTTPTEKPAPKSKARKTAVEPVTVPHVDLDIETVIAKHLKAGRDYDRLPNTSKLTLFKSGAEILAGVFNFRTTAKVVNRVEEYDKQFVLYEVQVTVFDKEGHIVAEGLGSCNSRERRYLKTDFATNLNTILKMGKKRAYIDAILTATHASKVFTQDIEDIVNFQREMNDDRR